MANVDQLIKNLVSFRTRSAAKLELLGKGAEAVAPLIKAMQSRHEGVRWSAIAILGELHAKEALPHLVEALGDPEVQTAAADALENITGESFGEDQDAWRRWLDMNAEGAVPQSDRAQTNSLSDDELVRQAFAGTQVAIEKTERGYVLSVPLDDRGQKVYVSFTTKDSDGVLLAVSYTRCGPADAKHYEWALRQNLKMSAGAVAVADVGGKPEFVIVDVLVRDHITPEMLAESVLRLAKKGDKIEAALTKSDQF
jgi:hypothetical protein